MTITAEHDSGPLLFTWSDAPEKEPVKPAKTQFKITVKPTAARRSRLDLPIYESEVQRALKQYYDNPVMRLLMHYENSPVVRLQRQLENNPVFQIQRMMDSALPSIPSILIY